MGSSEPLHKYLFVPISSEILGPLVIKEIVKLRKYVGEKSFARASLLNKKRLVLSLENTRIHITQTLTILDDNKCFESPHTS